MAQADPKRFATLDGMRGAAAIAVMIFHAGSAGGVSAPSGYLAVDLFFALSGFVLAHAYEPRLRDGMPLREFINLRVARLYPMYLVGTLVGAAFATTHPSAFLFLPHHNSNALFPGNVVMWSLLFELGANIMFAAFALRCGWKAIAAVLAVSGAMLLWAALGPLGSLSHGAYWETTWLGIPRTLFSFTIGVALCRAHARWGLRRVAAAGWLLPLALLGLLSAATEAAPWWELLCVAALFPALVWLGARWEAPKARLFTALGDLSYPLYCIHLPLLLAAGRWDLNVPLACAALVLAAWALDRWVDRPARAWLGKLARRRLPRSAALASA